MNSFEHRSRKFPNENSSSNEDFYANNYFRENFEEKSALIQRTNYEKERIEEEPLPMPIAYKKRVRIKFTQHQLDVLEATFQQHHYPTVDMVDELVEQLDLPTQKITVCLKERVWFQNRRARLKKSQPKIDEEKLLIKEETPQYDSGIHLEEDFSHESSSSPMPQAFAQVPSIQNHLVPHGNYFQPEHVQTSHAPIWPNFHYSLPMASYSTNISNAINPMLNAPFNYNSTDMFSPFVFHDISNYQYANDFSSNL